MREVIISNDFHNTEVTLQVVEGQLLSASQLRKIDTLCGMDECACGDIRGPQVHPYNLVWDHSKWNAARIEFEPLRHEGWSKIDQLVDDLADKPGGATIKRIEAIEQVYCGLSDSERKRARLEMCADEKTGCRYGKAKKRENRCVKVGSGGRNKGQTGYQIWLVWA